MLKGPHVYVGDRRVWCLDSSDRRSPTDRQTDLRTIHPLTHPSSRAVSPQTLNDANRWSLQSLRTVELINATARRQIVLVVIAPLPTLTTRRGHTSFVWAANTIAF